MISPSHSILIVEDSDEDYYATERALKKTGISNHLYRCHDGEEAVHFLKRTGPYEASQSSPTPNIILLDLNLPKKDGKEVLAIIKNDNDLKHIPVVVLTTSIDDRDIRACYQAGANSYIQKPVDSDRFFEAIKRLKDYWFEIVVLPKE